MDDDAARQLILAFENYLTQEGFGPEGLRSAQARGWLDQDGLATQDGRDLCQALAAQRDTRSAFRNVG
jgi:hypothetical protein